MDFCWVVFSNFSFYCFLGDECQFLRIIVARSFYFFLFLLLSSMCITLWPSVAAQFNHLFFSIASSVISV
jgi:hypothetical protein